MKHKIPVYNRFHFFILTCALLNIILKSTYTSNIIPKSTYTSRVFSTQFGSKQLFV